MAPGSGGVNTATNRGRMAAAPRPVVRC